MKDSYQVLVIASVSVLIGICLIFLSRSISMPLPYNPFLTPEAFFAMGVLFFGFSLGLLGAIGYIVRLEKTKPRTP